jgi:NAD(P)-dependent dehydrogenase (short-subunit alcohol dehydrogenase family)
MNLRELPLSDWDLFVLRHHKPGNLVLHFISAAMFFGSPIYGLLTHDWLWFGWFCLSGCIGTYAHYLTGDGTVTLRESSSSPRIVGYNLRMWWRVFIGRYGKDVRSAKRRLTQAQIQDGRTVLVTGASSGFGEAAVREFLARGFQVFATLRRLEQARIFEDVAPEERARLRCIELDVTNADHRDLLVAQVTSSGRLDVLVQNAGYGLFGALEDLGESDLRKQMEVNFFGVTLLTRALLPLLRTSKGTLIHVSSPAGVAGFPWTSAYCASKHALEGLTESLYYELSPEGVAVHIVTPSAHRTQFMGKARWVKPATSHYGDAVSAYRSVMEKNQQHELPPPGRVARVLADLAERRTVGLRVNIGANVRVLRAMVRFMPAWARHALVLSVFRGATRKYQQTQTSPSASESHF